MHVVVALGLIVDDHAGRVVPLLVVNAGISKVWPVGSRCQFIDRDKGGLDHWDVWSAIRVIRIGIFGDFESVRNIIAVGIRIQRV